MTRALKRPASPALEDGRETGAEAVRVASRAPQPPAETAASWKITLNDRERDHLIKAMTNLTPREREVACAVAEGGPNETIADRMCIAVPTLRTHLMRINQKLGTTSKADLVIFVAGRLLEGYRTHALRPEAIASKRMEERGLRLVDPPGRRPAPEENHRFR